MHMAFSGIKREILIIKYTIYEEILILRTTNNNTSINTKKRKNVTQWVTTSYNLQRATDMLLDIR